MCWSGQASFVMATIGITGAYFEFRKGKNLQDTNVTWKISKETNKYQLRAITLIYFSLMELLQAFNYAVLNQPGTLNALFSFLGYVHISIQPIFVSWFYLSFVPESVRHKWFNRVTWISAIAVLCLLARLIKHPSLPGCFSGSCIRYHSVEDIFKLHIPATNGCAISGFKSYVGDWHIAWQWVLNSCQLLTHSYTAVSYILPLFYGAYRIMIYTLLLGPILAAFLTGNPDEWAAIWCLLSIAFLMGVKIPWLENFLTVKPKSQ